jgi:hypothetical protein
VVAPTPPPPALFDLGELGLRIEPTIAMRNGTQQVFQCRQCGLVAVQTNLAPGPLGPCPACGRGPWSLQLLPVAGLHEVRSEA